MGLPPQWCRALFMCAEDPMVSWHPTSLFQHPPPPTEQESNQKDNEMSFLNDFYVSFWVMFFFSFFPTGAFFSLLPLSSLCEMSRSSSLVQYTCTPHVGVSLLSSFLFIFLFIFWSLVSSVTGGSSRFPSLSLTVWLALCRTVEVTGLAQDWPIKVDII